MGHLYCTALYCTIYGTLYSSILYYSGTPEEGMGHLPATGGGRDIYSETHYCSTHYTLLGQTKHYSGTHQTLNTTLGQKVGHTTVEHTTLAHTTHYSSTHYTLQ